MTVAISREMNLRGSSAHQDEDTLFMGGARPFDADDAALARFGLTSDGFAHNHSYS